MRNSSVKLLPVLPNDKILGSSDESRSRLDDACTVTDFLRTTILSSLRFSIDNMVRFFFHFLLVIRDIDLVDLQLARFA